MKTYNTKNVANAYKCFKRCEEDVRRSRHVGVDRYIKKAEEQLEAAQKEYRELSPGLDAIIKEAEGRASEHCINADMVMDALTEVDKKLSIAKRSMEGVTITCNINAQEFPRAYKDVPMATVFDAEFKSGSWRITDIRRDRCTQHRYIVRHTEESKKAIIEKLSRW